jgi:hypothetical protein
VSQNAPEKQQVIDNYSAALQGTVQESKDGYKKKKSGPVKNQSNAHLFAQ